MLSKITHRTLATIVLILIVVYGFFKGHVRIFFSRLAEWSISQIGLDPQLIQEYIVIVSSKEEGPAGVLGWLIYYPTYYLLHLVFIFLLFKHSRNVRNVVAVGLSLVVLILIVLILAGKYFELNMLYKISYESFQKLFGLPFILLFIEGGRLLYNDIFQQDNQ